MLRKVTQILLTTLVLTLYAGNLDSALAALVDGPDAAEASERSFEYLRSGDVVNAMWSLNEAIRLEPENVDYRYALASIYINSFAQVTEGTGWSREQLLKRIVCESRILTELRPGDRELAHFYASNLNYVDQLGATQPWETIREAWERYLALPAPAPTVGYVGFNQHRAQCFLLLAHTAFRHEEYQAANDMIDRALQLVPDSDRAERLQAKVNNRLRRPA